MADAPVVHMGENSPEHVAMKLLVSIAGLEDRRVHGLYGGSVPADRKWLLDTYAQCLEATKGFRVVR